ncbi:transcriptional regulator, PaaX family protein [Comamonas testosteroni]|uniref:Transcriptional regulator, PaaX family protein n=1 Tax=Comamonas testosteroni TaxID=285 RepID=A0A373FPD4_COMTE|nr:transcriptional regulator, PaaX family protein [Comamonas testosteroni]RGE46013.1 transcriptional regulator, PaaX family protein [Comamonas testosteroni]
MDKSCNVLPRRPSATDLILDLLVARGMPLSAPAIARAAALFDIGENAVRVCLSRLVSAEKIERTARGVYRAKLQPQHLAYTVENWHKRELLRQPWNGGWIAIQDASISRSDKTLWRRHQRALGLRGFASLSPHLHIRPDNLKVGFGAMASEMASFGVAPGSCLMKIHQMDSLHETKARSLWNIRALGAAHQHWMEMVVNSQQRLGTLPLASAVRETLLLGRSAIAHLLRDPLLPEELMSSEIRHALRAQLQTYQQQALELWLTWLSQHD